MVIKSTALAKDVTTVGDDGTTTTFHQCQVCVALGLEPKMFKHSGSTTALLRHLHHDHMLAESVDEAKQKMPMFRAWCTEKAAKLRSRNHNDDYDEAGPSESAASTSSAKSKMTKTPIKATRPITASFPKVSLRAEGGANYHRDFLTFLLNIVDLRPLSTTSATGMGAYFEYLNVPGKAVPTPTTARLLIDRLYEQQVKWLEKQLSSLPDGNSSGIPGILFISLL